MIKRWCEKPLYHTGLSDALVYGWKVFENVVKLKSRYAFYQYEEGVSTIPPCEFLDALSRVISELNLYTTIEKNTFLYRVRTHAEKEKLENVSELAPPPIEHAVYPNRMSPAGIPMFYGAFDIGTAIKETFSYTDVEQIATVAKFKLLKDITLVDLSKIPPIPRFFEKSSIARHQIVFLNDFVAEISKEILKDGREHIEYVPTQVVTEHIRYAHHKRNDDRKIDGIIYPSSKNKGKKSVVVFCENEHCVANGLAESDSFFELESLQRAKIEKCCKFTL